MAVRIKASQMMLGISFQFRVCVFHARRTIDTMPSGVVKNLSVMNRLEQTTDLIISTPESIVSIFLLLLPSMKLKSFQKTYGTKHESDQNVHCLNRFSTMKHIETQRIVSFVQETRIT